MSFEVDPAELTSAANKIAEIIAPRACYHVPLTSLDAATFGHAGLAEWMEAVGEDADVALRELASSGQAVAETLRASAAYYRSCDAKAAHAFVGPVRAR